MNVRTWTLALVVALAASSSATGCKKKKADPGPSCRQIVSYMMRFSELGAFDERAAIEECRKQKWTAKQRTCMYASKDLNELAHCVPAMKINNTGPTKAPLPEWHPKTDQPIESGPERLQREAEEKEKAAKEAAAAGSGAAPAPAPAPSTPAPAPAPAPAKPM